MACGCVWSTKDDRVNGNKDISSEAEQPLKKPLPAYSPASVRSSGLEHDSFKFKVTKVEDKSRYGKI